MAILGAGSWGSALAFLLGSRAVPVRLWCRDPEQAARMRGERANPGYLPDQRLPDPVSPTSDLPEALRDARIVLAVVPAQALRETLRRARPHLAGAPALVIAAKGLERDTGKRLSVVAEEELGTAARLGVLSGPNLAGEIVRGIPTATVVASEDPDVIAALQPLLGTPTFRVYGNRDVAGVELGGALKNPIAIAAGISDGLGYGNNTKATLLTRGLAEITRLGVAAGGQSATFRGLSGLGDLIATANSPLSRNYQAGLALGRGASLAEAEASLGHVAEGIPTTEAACRLATSLGTAAPILEALRGVLFHGASPREAVTALMTRPYRDEDPD